MRITKREFLKQLGSIGVAGATCSALADEFIATNKKLPPGSVGDPDNVMFGQRIFPIPHTIEDGKSCFIADGKVVMPAHEVPMFHETDVVVVGGGPAGFSAAVAAARAGASVALVEKAGSLGGLFTNGMVLIMLATSRNDGGGNWTIVTKGLCEEFMNRVVALGPRAANAAHHPGREHWQPTVDPEAAKYLMDTMIAEAGVELFFHAYGIDVIQDGEAVKGIVFHSKQGLQAILAKQVVDCTGDGDMFFAAGCDYRQITHGIGFVARLGNVDRISAKVPNANPGTDIYGMKKYWPLHGNEPANKSSAWATLLGPQGDGLSVRDLSKAEVMHRKYWWEHVAEMQKTPGWEDVYIVNTCSQIGSRATRILESERICDREFIRRGDNKREIIGWFGQDGGHEAIPVPYRVLVPTKSENIIAAGRCIGAPDTIDTFRLICPCFVSGQAAGIAAALAARTGMSPRNLAYTAVRNELERQEVYL